MSMIVCKYFCVFLLMQATAFLLDKLHIILAKSPKEEIKSEVLPMVFNTLDSNSLQGQEAALNTIAVIKEYVDDQVIKKIVLPRAKNLFARSSNVKMKINALTCIKKLLDSLDKMIILDEVLPFLTEISCQDAEVVMSIVGIYSHLLSNKRFGLTHNLVATKVMPPLIPHTVNPGLTMDQVGGGSRGSGGSGSGGGSGVGDGGVSGSGSRESGGGGSGSGGGGSGSGRNGSDSDAGVGC
ncbi:SCY1-like protein 2, partial [Octopus sinensis]|uniref:SCY1-like protein 2 n=1 Tax=Octopus sinensis TaxID=2607531 RepID=A0A7E6EKK9_9MOLL